MTPQTLPDIVMLDFDGTVADTMPFLTRVATSLLVERYGLSPEKAAAAYIGTTGLPFIRQIELILPGDSRNPSTVSEFEGQKKAHLMEFELFPDAGPAIAEIRRRGMKVCLSSGNVEGLIIRFLESKNLAVDLVMGYRPGFEKGPDHFEFALRTFRSSPDGLVFVGDSLKDGLAAIKSGIRFIARTGLLSEEEFRASLPDIPIVDSLEGVLPLLGVKRAQDSSDTIEPSRASKYSAGDRQPSG